MDDLEDEMPEIVELIQKEGLIEKDKEGQWSVTPRGMRRIQDKALEDLFQTFRRDSLGRHDTPEKGEGSVVLRGHAALCLRRFAGQSESARDAQERLHPPGRGRADPAQLGRLRRPRDRVSNPVCDRRPDRHERLDGPLRQVLHDQEGGAGAPGDGAGEVSARLAADDRVLHLRQPDERAAAPQLGAQAGEHVTTAGCTCGSTSTTRRAESPSISPTSTPACGWREASCRDSRRRTSRSS